MIGNIDLDFYKRNKPAYCVTGLPRSMTAFMAAFLSTGKNPCFHEPEAHFDFIPFGAGVSSSGVIELLDDIGEEVPIIVIRRDLSDVLDSASKIGILSEDTYNMLSKWDKKIDSGLPKRSLFYDFDTIGIDQLSDIWKNTNKEEEFDKYKADLFLSLNIQVSNFKH